MILLGDRWSIGDGTSVKIFKDSWPLGSNSGRILSPVSVLSEDATVDQLVDSESRWWEYESYRFNFFYRLMLS